MLFHFELHPVERINPWGEPPKQSLSWFALTDGLFHIDTGHGLLCRYTAAHTSEETGSRDVDYQVASIADDVLSVFAEAIAPLPPWAEELAQDWPALVDIRTRVQNDEEFYPAFRWLGERSPWLSYLVASPRFSFVRIADEIAIHWDNRDLEVDGKAAWEAPLLGSVRLPLEEFVVECRSFAERLLETMTQRIDSIEAGAKAQIELDADNLRRQHVEWEERLQEYLTAEYTPDLPWDEALAAWTTLRRRYQW